MPCNSDYLNPTHAEADSKRVAGLLVYVLEKFGRKVNPTYIKARDDYYGNPDLLDKMVVELCAICSAMSDLEKESYIYDAKNKTARDLADWWEEHQEADKQRIAKEKEEKELDAVRKVALSKLNTKERKALGLDE